jgi:glycosyltransferase involved in cell wall biosynthesis
MCVIAGATLQRRSDIAYLDDIKRLAESLGVDRRIVFTGFVNRVEDVYAAADIVVNPARVPEALGRAALEALMAGRAVISARVGGTPEVIRDGKNGLLVEPDRPHEIARAIALLSRDPELRRLLVEHGRKTVQNSFDEVHNTMRFLKVVESVL